MCGHTEAIYKRRFTMASDKRFEVSLALNIQEVKDEGATPFFDNTLTYHDMTYDGVVALESMLMGVLTQLNEAGVLKAMELGLGDQLAAMGLGDKVAALSAKQ
jgi:hypothetical protein